MGNPPRPQRRADPAEALTFVYGRVSRGDNQAYPVKGYLVEADIQGRQLDRTLTDGSGRFLLEWLVEPGPRSGKVRVRAFTPARVPYGEKQVGVSELVSPYTVVFKPKGHPTATQRRPPDRARRRRNVRVEALEANGDYPVRVESACHPVKLAWRVGPPPRPWAKTLKIDMLEDGMALGTNLPIAGSLTVTRHRSAIYTLVITAMMGRKWRSDSKSVAVKRFKTLALSFEGELFTESDIPAGVLVTCPAPDGGLPVKIESSDEEVMSEGGTRIGAGGTSAVARLISGGKGGYVEVTGLAEGHLRDTVRLMVRQKTSSGE